MKVYNEIDFYKEAKSRIIDKGYSWEIEMVESRSLETTTQEDFMMQYAWVVLSAGMKNQVIEKIFQDWSATHDPECIGHLGKQKALSELLSNYEKWFSEFKTKKTLEEQLDYLESKPFIGKITKYHLARNLGIDVAKPDRHLQRLAEKFGYKDVQILCENISNIVGDRIGVVDVVLWRAMNLRVM